MENEHNKISLVKIAFWQAAGLIGYCGLVALLFVYGNEWFGPMSWWGPLLFLVLLVMSVLVSALVTLGYTVYLIWDKKQVREGLTLVTYTAWWLMVFVVSVIVVMAT